MAHRIERLSIYHIEDRFTCPICLDEQDKIDAVAQGILGHDRMHPCHLACLKTWVATSRAQGREINCPVCRAEIDLPADEAIQDAPIDPQVLESAQRIAVYQELIQFHQHLRLQEVFTSRIALNIRAHRRFMAATHKIRMHEHSLNGLAYELDLIRQQQATPALRSASLQNVIQARLYSTESAALAIFWETQANFYLEPLL